MRNNFFLNSGYASSLVEVIIKGFSEKTFVCPHDSMQLHNNKANIGIKLRRENNKWYMLLRGGDNYGGEFETEVIESNSVQCSKPRFEGKYQKLGFLKFEGQASVGTFLENGYILSEEGRYIIYE